MVYLVTTAGGYYYRGVGKSVTSKTPKMFASAGNLRGSLNQYVIREYNWRRHEFTELNRAYAAAVDHIPLELRCRLIPEDWTVTGFDLENGDRTIQSARDFYAKKPVSTFSRVAVFFRYPALAVAFVKWLDRVGLPQFCPDKQPLEWYTAVDARAVMVDDVGKLYTNESPQ